MHAASGPSRFVVQVGAHEHHRGGHDIVPQLIRRGWHALLVEPQPNLASKLRTLYANATEQVRVVEVAVCPGSQTSISLWVLNGTETLGSNHSDIRCLGRETFVSAIASLNRAHVQRFQGQYYLTPNQCRRCSIKLNRPLPPNCMRHVFNHNIREKKVRCASIVDTIQEHQHGAPDFLVIDAEGAEATVLQQYFASGLRLPARIRYEKTYMGPEVHHNITTHLRSRGMEISLHGRMDVEFSSSASSDLFPAAVMTRTLAHTPSKRRGKRGGPHSSVRKVRPALKNT